MKRFICVLLAILMVIGTVSSGFADSGGGTFDAGDWTELKVTGNAIGAKIAFNGSGEYSITGIGYDFIVDIPYLEDKLVIELSGETSTGTADLKIMDGFLVDYEIPSNGPEYARYEVSKSALENGQELDFDVKWIFDGSSSQQMVAHVTLIINFMPAPKYNLTMSAIGPGSTDPIIGTHQYDGGTTVSVEAIPEDGARFVQWNGDPLVPTSATTTVFMDSNKYAEAVFEMIPYTLTVTHEGEGTTVPSGASTVYYGDEVPLSATASEGWHFVRWEGDISSTSASTSVGIEGNTNVHAVFQEDEVTYFTLQIDKDGDGYTDPVLGSYDYPAGTTVAVTAYPNTAEGWYFNGWTGTHGSEVIDDVILMDGDKWIIADFDLEPYTLTVTHEGEGTTVPSGASTVYYGDEVPLSATASEGWHFVRWEGDISSTSASTSIGIVGNTNVHAVFQEDEVTYYTLHIDKDGDGYTDPSVGSHDYPAGTTVGVTAYPNYSEGWYFDEWTGTHGSEVIDDVILMDGDKWIIADFDQEGPVYYDLHIDTTGSGYTVPTDGIVHTYMAGTTVMLETHAVGDGWYFSNWTGTDGSTVYYEDYAWNIDMTSDKWITANFGFEGEESTGALVIYIEGNGTTTPSEGTHTYSTSEGAVSVSVSAHSASGWYFSRWEGPVEDGKVTINPGDYKEITAVFRPYSPPPPRRYTLDISMEGSGDVDPFIGSRSYTYGTMVDVAAEPADGWTFLGWFGDDGGDVVDGEIRMDANKSIIAVFQGEPPLSVDYFLTVDVQGEGSVAPSRGSHKYAENATAFVAATPAEGWTFVGWFGTNGGEIVDGELLMNGDKSIMAVFEPKELPYTGSALPLMNWTIGLVVMSIGAFFRKEKQ